VPSIFMSTGGPHPNAWRTSGVSSPAPCEGPPKPRHGHTFSTTRHAPAAHVRHYAGKDRSSPALIPIPRDLSENSGFKVSAAASSLYLQPVRCQLTE
jgi:hypothetical protein